MTTIRRSWRFLRMLAHLFKSVFVNLTAEHHPTNDGEKLLDPQFVSDWQAHLLTILNIKVTVSGSVPHQSVMLVANHVSWLDIPVIASTTHAAFLSKYGIRKWPVVGWLAASSGAIFIKRGQGEAQQVAEAMGHHLDGDRQLAIFPEGTTTDGTQVNKFFPRLFAAAIETNTNVLPVTLHYTVNGEQDRIAPYAENQTFIGNLFLLLGRPASEVQIIFGEPVSPQDKDRRSLAEECRQVIAGNLQQLA